MMLILAEKRYQKKICKQWQGQAHLGLEKSVLAINEIKKNY